MARAKKPGRDDRRRARREAVAREAAERQEARVQADKEARSRRVLAFRGRGMTFRVDISHTVVVAFDPSDSDPLRDIEARVAIQQILRLKAEKDVPN